MEMFLASLVGITTVIVVVSNTDFITNIDIEKLLTKFK